MRKLSSLSLALALPALILQSAAGAEALSPAAQWLPQEAVLALEITQPKALLDPVMSAAVGDAVAALPTYQQFQNAPQFRIFLAVVKNLETQLNADWRTATRNLVGGGITLGVGPGGETLIAVDAQDPKLLEQLHETFNALVGAQRGKPGQPPAATPRDYHGVKVWSFAPTDSHAILGNRLLLANRASVLEAALDLRDKTDGRSLAAAPAYQAAKQAVGKDAVAMLYLDMRAMKKNSKLKGALQGGANPLAALMFASTADAVQKSNWLAIGFYVQGDKLILKLVTDSPMPDPAGPSGFAMPHKAGEGILPDLEVSGRIAAISLYRDLHGFYAAKDTLFPERTSGLIFFENMMGIFFSGMNLTEEVMGETQPEVRLVVANQQYDPAIGTPAVQFPAFAAVFRMRNPQAFGEVVEEAWQKAIGLANFTRGQKALPGLVIDRQFSGDVKYTVAAFRPPGKREGGEIDSRFNFRPSLARVGDYLVMSSTDGLTRELLGLLKAELAHRPVPSSTAHSLMEIDGAQLRAILNANRETLVRKNMVDKGINREQAEAQTGLLYIVLDVLNQATLSLGNEGGHPQAKLELRLKVPETKRAVTMR